MLTKKLFNGCENEKSITEHKCTIIATQHKGLYVHVMNYKACKIKFLARFKCKL